MLISGPEGEGNSRAGDRGQESLPPGCPRSHLTDWRHPEVRLHWLIEVPGPFDNAVDSFRALKVRTSTLN